MDLRAWLHERSAEVDRFLDAHVPAADAPPAALHGALRHLLFPGGKRLRPALALAACEARLLTPYGLRSLAPGSPDYRPHYFGDLFARDAAYHQGTVWGWLIGPWVDAWRKVHPGEHPARFLDPLLGRDLARPNKGWHSTAEDTYVMETFENVQIYNLMMKLLGIEEHAAPTNGTKGFWDKYF